MAKIVRTSFLASYKQATDNLSATKVLATIKNVRTKDYLLRKIGKLSVFACENAVMAHNAIYIRCNKLFEGKKSTGIVSHVIPIYTSLFIVSDVIDSSFKCMFQCNMTMHFKYIT